MSQPIKWSGSHMFFITGVGEDDDTIRIDGGQRKTEKLLKLVLPSLCITFADMQFANQIGGVQKKYPESIDYGPAFFDPPKVIEGEKEIRKFTLIRGAKRVTIGPRETVIEFESYRTLVVPQLQIKKKERATASVLVPEIEITVSQPFNAKIMQFADGRHVGGVQFQKAHPDWKPTPINERYDLWIRTINEQDRRAIPEVKVILSSWNEGQGAFVEEAHWYTNKMGIVDQKNLPCSDKKLLSIEQPPYLTQTWRFRPLPGQKLKRTFKLWKNKTVTFPYVWKPGDNINTIAALTRTPAATILRMNKVRSPDQINAGQTVNIPAFEPTYRVEARDTLESLTTRFCYNNVEELASVNHLTKPYKIFQGQRLLLPGWRFFVSRSEDEFDKLDAEFSIPKGWVRSVRKTHHDKPNRVFRNEVIAIPTKDFVSKHKMRNIRKVDSDQP